MEVYMEGDEPLPHSMYDVERLVLRLYEPGCPAEEHQQIQRILQDIQKGPEAFPVANALFERNSDILHFFGSLTLTVKINTHGCVTPLPCCSPESSKRANGQGGGQARSE
jgi:hypothetical protein